MNGVLEVSDTMEEVPHAKKILKTPLGKNVSNENLANRKNILLSPFICMSCNNAFALGNLDAEKEETA